MSLTDNLTHYWKLDESSGNASDAVGSLTLTNTNSATYNTGRIGNGVVTTNSSDRLEASNDAGVQGGAVSISLWVKLSTDLNATDTQYGFFEVADAGTQVAYIIGAEYNSGNRFIEVNRQKSAVANQIVSYNTTLGTTNWHHIVATYDTTTLKLYLDGVLVGTPLATSGNGTSGLSDLVQISYAGNYLANSPKGTVDEVGIWSRALSDTEISILYNNGNGFQYNFSSGTVTANFYVGTGDGYVRYNENPGDTWSNVFNTVTNATLYDTTNTRFYCECNQNSTFKQMFRTLLPIDTSLLTSAATISSASLSMKEEDSNFADADATRVYLSGTSLTAIDNVNDFARSNWDETSDYGNKLMSDWTSGTRASITLTASGISYISKTGTTYFSLLNSLDRSATPPTGINSHGWSSANNATWSNRPYLTITYTLSSSAIKTINGLAKASVKTVNGLAIASVKTWDGLA